LSDVDEAAGAPPAEPLRVTDWSLADELRPVGPVVLVTLHHEGERLAALVAACRERGVPVVHAPAFGSVPGAGLEPLPEEYLIRRHRDSAFYCTELDLVLRGHRAGTVLLAGGTSDTVVHWSAVDAHQYDYHFRTVADLSLGTDPQLHEAALRAMKYLQRDSLVTSAAVTTWLAGLDASADPADPADSKDSTEEVA